MPPQRILYVNHVSRLSGAEQSLLELLRHLDRNRFEPVVALPPDGELTERLQALGIPCHPLPLRRLRKTFNPFRLADALANVAAISGQLTQLIRRERIALVHANSNTAQLYAGTAARRGGVPCLWHTRDLVPLGMLGGWLGRHATAVIAISDCVRRQIAPCTRDPEKLLTIRHGIDPAAFAPLCLAGKQAGNLFHVGMIGQMVPWKNHIAFLEAAARLATVVPEARFVVAGGDLFHDHPGYRAHLEARAAELGLRDRILFTGYQPDVARLLESFDVLVHPATREPLGRVILEAMAMGKPVVAVNACGPSEIIRHGIDGLLAASDGSNDLADAVLSLIRDPAQARRIGDNARRRVEQDFNIRHTVSEIEAVYERLLADGAAPCA
jgi:glycosyltransferase involved in cell wall biosynthesis